MTEFRKYNSIENHYRREFIAKVQATVPEDEQWCATEKIHGANIDMILHEGGILRSSRNQTVGDAEFNGSRRIATELADNFRKLRADIVGAKQDVVHVYGEIYGGVYQGAKPAHARSAVQKGVQYSPNNEFRAFDIFTAGDYLAYDSVIDLCT